MNKQERNKLIVKLYNEGITTGSEIKAELEKVGVELSERRVQEILQERLGTSKIRGNAEDKVRGNADLSEVSIEQLSDSEYKFFLYGEADQHRLLKKFKTLKEAVEYINYSSALKWAESKFEDGTEFIKLGDYIIKPSFKSEMEKQTDTIGVLIRSHINTLIKIRDYINSEDKKPLNDFIDSELEILESLNRKEI